MNMKIIFKRTALIITVLLVIQITTYSLFSHKQLKDKLITDWFGAFNHSYDSVLVRDFCTPFCGNKDPFTYYSHNLEEDENFVMRRFGARFVKFQQPPNIDTLEEKKFRLVYHTHTRLATFEVPMNMFKAIQTEELTRNRTEHYTREVTYIWVLFFWVSRFELVKVE